MSSINRKGLVHLLRLMTKNEKRSFKADFNLAENANDDETIEAIVKLPKYEAIRAFIRAGDPTIILLREVFEILATFGIATKTTGCVFVLANPAKPEEHTELAFSQQTVDAVCSWPAGKKWNQVSNSLADLLSAWIRFRPVWQALLRKAEPICKRGRFDPVKTYIRQHMTFGPDRYSIDKDAQQVLRHFADRVEHIADRLKEIRDGKIPNEVTRFLRDFQQLKNAVVKCFNEPRGHCRSWESRPQEPPSQSVIERYTSRRFVTDFDKFHEDVYSLADLIRGEGVIDMLQIDIWSARPQLFEVWVLLKLLSWLRGRGYMIELLKTENFSERSPFRWNLSYSKDSKPCAVVRDVQTGIQQFLFYQLYRPSGDMPDISLLESSDPYSSAVWSVDPKHSEKGGYSKSEYQKTAIRYRDNFGATLSLVVEYFDRSKMGNRNPIEFDPGAKLIRGCRPDGSGLPILLRELGEFHPARSQTLVCIDFSGSFSSKRDNVLERLRQRHRSGFLTNVASECICFAGNTTIVSNFDNWLSGEHNSGISPRELVEGTASAPLVSTISDLKERMPISEVLIVTDGEFDIPVERLSNRIHDELGIAVALVTS
jgi:hypothetical protein